MNTSLLLLLAWRPFLEPLNINASWILWYIPIALAMAVVYKTLRVTDLATLPKQVLSMTLRMTAVMIAAAVVIWILTLYL